MSFEIDMEQLDPKLLVIGWQRWLDSACVCRFPFESKCHGNGCKRKHASLCTQNELIQHHAHHKKQRMKDFDRRLEFHALLERECRFSRLKQVGQFATRQQTKALALLSQAGNEFFLW